MVFLSPAFYWRGFLGRLRSNLKAAGWRLVGFAAGSAAWLSVPFWCPHGGCGAACSRSSLPVHPLRPVERAAGPAGRARVAVAAQPRIRPPVLHRGEHRGPVLRGAGAGRGTAGRAAGRRPGSGGPRRRCSTTSRPGCSSSSATCPTTTTTTATRRLRSGRPRRTRASGDIDTGPEGPPYQEVWGMGAAIDRMFRAWEGELRRCATTSLTRSPTSGSPATRPPW